MGETGQRGRASRLAGALGGFFDVDDPWVRPGPTPRQRRSDVWMAAAAFVFVVVALELTRSMGALTRFETPLWQQYLAVAIGTLPLAWRRRRPILVMVLLQVHLFACGIWVSAVAYQLAMQIVYCFALVSGVGWARDRRALAYAVGGILVLMFGWLTWSYAWGSAIESISEHFGNGERIGLLSPYVASAAYEFLINVMFFGGSLTWGRGSWRAARQLAIATEQAATIEDQASHLREQAVVNERLRIARELHDVVAHHVSVMGVQAAAARRVLARDPVAASEALSSIEQSSRQAVGEMRTLLGTLRAPRQAASGTPEEPASRSPEPGLPDVPTLLQESTSERFAPTYDLVEDVPGALAAVPRALSLSAYRVVQEALSNVRKHSTAASARVVVRVQSLPNSVARHVEVEVLDDGRPRGSTSGSGLGQLGMRERVASHGGQLEVGPRAMGGYRVRVRFPLDRGAVTSDTQHELREVTSDEEDAARREGASVREAVSDREAVVSVLGWSQAREGGAP